MSGLSWISYKEKKILYVDYGPSQIENVGMLSEQAEVEDKDPNLLILSDFEGTVTSYEFMQKVKEYGRRFRKDRETNIKNAVLGITGVKKTLFDSYIFFTGDTHTKAFKTLEEAKEWLVSD